MPKINEIRTLQEIVNEMPDDERLYIGSKDGNGFFFIGTKEEYSLDIDLLSGEHYDRMCAALSKHTAEAESMIAHGVRDKLENEAEADYWSYVADFGNSLKMHAKNINSITWRIQSYIPLHKRLVVETRKKRTIPEEIGTAIIIEGYEIGQFWFHSEYQAAKENRKEREVA